MWLLARGTSADASAAGLPAEFDEVVLKRWAFTVKGESPDFVVTSYARKTEELPPIGPTDAPYITRSTVGKVTCQVGTIYHIAPINASTLVHEHAAGGGARISFTVRNQPPGFFIDPNSGEIQGIPTEKLIDKRIKTALIAIDSDGNEAFLEEITATIALLDLRAVGY